MKNKIIIIVSNILILFILSNCSNHSSIKPTVIEFNKFEHVNSLKAKTVEWLDLWLCTDIAIYNRLLIAIDWGKDKIFNIYNLDSQKFIGSFGTHGKGPGEFFRVPELNSVFYIENNEVFFQIFNNEKNTIQNINLTMSLKENKTVISCEIKLPDDFISKKPFLTKEMDIYGSKNGQLLKYDLINKRTKYCNEAINIGQDLPAKFAEIARIMYIELSNNDEYIIGSFNALRRLHIYNQKGELLKIIKEKDKRTILTNYKEFYKENPVCYSKAFATNKKILVLNQNRVLPQMTNGELLLFNYQGKALSRYKLDRWISLGAVDWQNNIFYSLDNQEGVIITYDLPGL